MTSASKEKRLILVMTHLPFGGLIDTYEEDDEILAIYWGWIENDKEMSGWFNMEGEPIQSPDRVE